MKRSGNEEENPHTWATDIVAPIVEKRATVVMWSLSLRNSQVT